MIEALFYGVPTLGIIAALVGRAMLRRKVSAAAVVEAPVARRRLIVTALLVCLALLSGLFAAMGVSLEAWPFASGAAAVSALLVAALWLTRKPIAVVRFDGTHLTDGHTSIVLSQPFELSSAIKIPAAIPAMRGHPWQFVTVRQNAQSLAFCFPWELGLSGNAQPTSEAIPKLVLDWRGAVIFERLSEELSLIIERRPLPPARRRVRLERTRGFVLRLRRVPGLHVPQEFFELWLEAKDRQEDLRLGMAFRSRAEAELRAAELNAWLDAHRPPRGSILECA